MPESPDRQDAGVDPLDVRVGRVLNEFLDRRARGEAVSEVDLLAEHPDIADELREALAVLQDMQPAAGPAGSGNRPACESLTAPLPDIEGYEILRELHHGGQGAVYQAIQKSTKRKVAIKVLLEGLHASPGARKRFEREIELVAQLKHPNIIAILDSGVSGGGLQYYIMDYIRGLPRVKF